MSENTSGDSLRVERRSVSDLNPWLSWLGPAGEAVFFQTYGNLYSVYQAEDDEKPDAAQPSGHPREQALETLPQLLAERADRERLLTCMLHQSIVNGCE